MFKRREEMRHGGRTLISLLFVYFANFRSRFCLISLLFRSVTVLFIMPKTRDKSSAGSQGAGVDKNPSSEFETTSMLNDMLHLSEVRDCRKLVLFVFNSF